MDTNETTIYSAVLITAIVLAVFIGYFGVIIFRNHRRHFKLLSKHFIAEMERLEDERTRIARDLHDELGPVLAVTKIHVGAVEPNNEKEKGHLAKAITNIEFVAERLREIAKDLTPSVLEKKGLETVLKDLFAQFDGTAEIKMKLVYKVKESISAKAALHIFRIVQELVHNGVKHSKASELFVNVHERKKKIYVLYTDNGRGMPNEINYENEGLGLSSLRSRAEMLGGKMSFENKKGKGVEYFFELPLDVRNENKDQNSNS